MLVLTGNLSIVCISFFLLNKGTCLLTTLSRIIGGGVEIGLGFGECGDCALL